MRRVAAKALKDMTAWRKYGLMMELADMLDSKSRFCGFKSRSGYQGSFNK